MHTAPVEQVCADHLLLFQFDVVQMREKFLAWSKWQPHLLQIRILAYQLHIAHTHRHLGSSQASNAIPYYSNSNTCTVPMTRTRLGDRSFAVAGP